MVITNLKKTIITKSHISSVLWIMVPTWTGKPGKIRKIFPVREFYPKYWKSEDNLASFYFFSDFLMQVYLLDFCAP